MQGGINVHDFQSLQDMLDVTNRESKAALDRPESQTVGYSLKETATPVTTTGPSEAGGAPAGITPGTIAPQISAAPLPQPSQAAGGKKQPSSAIIQQKQRQSQPKGKDIWAEDEVSAVGSAPVKTDTREEPEYDIVYTERMNPEDAYLGIDFTKDSSSMGCEEITVRIQMPKVKDVRDLEVDVHAAVLSVRSKVYRAEINLPRKVVEKKGSAKWDGVKKVLSVTMQSDMTGQGVKVMSLA